LNNGLNQLKIISGYLNIPDRVEKEAARLYRMAAEKGITRARSTEKLIAACVYIAAKMQDMPKTLNEVAEATKLDKHVIAKTYKLVIRKLGMKLMPTSPVDFVGRFASDLGLSPEIQTKTVQMLEKVQKMGLNSGKNPTSLAAVCLYITSLLNKTKVTQTKIAKVSGITETTLRNRCKEILQALNIKKKELKKR
jgi:transcription initiation factor TFIIB